MLPGIDIVRIRLADCQQYTFAYQRFKIQPAFSHPELIPCDETMNASVIAGHYSLGLSMS
jgi:hypothetical protein